MSAFDNARKFFEACEAAEGWEGCKAYVVDGAPFKAQSEPLVDVKTVEAYCNWMAGLGKITAPGATYDRMFHVMTKQRARLFSLQPTTPSTLAKAAPYPHEQRNPLGICLLFEDEQRQQG